MWSVDIDGTDITRYCQSITWHPKLSRPASLVVRVPGQFVNAEVGVSEMHLINGGLLFSGPVWYIEDSGDPNTTYSEITAYDHLIYMGKRLCKTGTDYPVTTDPTDPNQPGPCNLADPHQVILDKGTAPAILGYFIEHADDCENEAPYAPWQIQKGTIAGGGVDMTGIPAEWPMTIADMAELLLSSGALGIIVHPGYGTSTVDLTNGDVVNDLSGSVSIDYATGGFNSQTASKTYDMEDVVNALWYLLGPRVHFYAGDISHWAGSITPTAKNQGYDGNRGSPGYPPGEPTEFWPPALSARWMGSRNTYGYMQEIQIHDEKDDEQTTVRPMFEALFAKEAYLRALPKLFMDIRPERATGSVPTFSVGDLISVTAGSKLGGGFSGNIMVFEFEIAIDADGVADYTTIVGSVEH